MANDMKTITNVSADNRYRKLAVATVSVENEMASSRGKFLSAVIVDCKILWMM